MYDFTEVDLEVQNNLLNDVTDLLQLGVPEETYFQNIIKKEENINAFKPGMLKIDIGLSSDLIQINRKTSNLLDWIGDCGGFIEALKVILGFLVSGYNNYVLQSVLTRNLVRFVPSTSNSTSTSKKSRPKHEKRLERKTSFRETYLDPPDSSSKKHF